MRKSQSFSSADPSTSRSMLSESHNDDCSKLDRVQSIQSILVVDPDPDFSSTVSDYLKLFGYNICYRTDIAEGLDYAKSHHTDVIFLADNFEYNHPIDVLRRFKKALPNTLIAILASRGDDQLAVELLKSGADDYLSRRVKDNDILTSIAAMLDNFIASGSSFTTQTVTRESPPRNVYSGQELITDEIFTKRDQPVELPAEASYLSSLENLPGQLIFLDENFSVRDVNKNCLNLLGYSKEDVISHTIKNILPTQFFAELVDQLEQYSNDEKLNIGDVSIGDTGRSFELVLNASHDRGIPINCSISLLSMQLYPSNNNEHINSEFNKRVVQGYLLSIDDLSEQKANQADMLYQNMWNNLLRAFAHRFINLHLDEFSQEITAVVAETANFFRLDRVSIYLLDKKQHKAKIYLEWLKAGEDSLKVFSKKIELESSMHEFEKILQNKTQILQPSHRIKKSTMEQTWGLSEHYSQVEAVSCMVVPIVIKSEVTGWMSMDFQTDSPVWEEKDIEMLAPLTDLLSQAFELRAKEEQRKVTHQKLSENYGQLSEQAFSDGLTNLANRRYFDKVLESEVRRASREQSNIALLFCDVDYFKAYNDSYGHMEGDLCLKAIAEQMQKEFQRAGDFVARFGGEEFAVILSGTLADDAFDSAEKLRKRIYDMNLDHKGSPLGRIAMSIGISSIIAPEPNDSKKLLSKADKALYKAKNKGRNRVEVSAFSPR